MNLINLLGNDNHIFAVYPNKDTEIDDCFSFLKEGLENNEFVLIILEEPSIHKLYRKIYSEFGKDNTKGMDNSDSVVITQYQIGTTTTIAILTLKGSLQNGKKLFQMQRRWKKGG